MSTTTANRTTSTTVTKSNGAVRVIALLTMIAGLIFVIAGGATWAMVASQLKEEQITVAAVTAADPGSLAGKLVQDPFTAYAQANAIKHHSLTAGGGLTYAQLGDAINAQKAKLTKDGVSAADQAKDATVLKLTGERTTAMNGSFLRASLFTSVVAFGIAALVMGLGVLFILIGWAMRKLAGDAQLSVVTSEPSARA